MEAHVGYCVYIKNVPMRYVTYVAPHITNESRSCRTHQGHPIIKQTTHYTSMHWQLGKRSSTSAVPPKQSPGTLALIQFLFAVWLLHPPFLLTPFSLLILRPKACIAHIYLEPDHADFWCTYQCCKSRWYFEFIWTISWSFLENIALWYYHKKSNLLLDLFLLILQFTII